MLTRVAIVVPAHNEEELLPDCLAALAVARAAITVPSTVIVVLDACTDGTAAVAAAGGAHTVVVGGRNVGAARRAGADAALRRPGWRGCWLATTDADSTVPPGWLARQLDYARRGADVVAGTVDVATWAGWPPAVADRYLALYRQRIRAGGHDHVHGANLGLTARAYRTLGGFAPRRLAEDQALVDRAVRAGLHVRWATDLPVRTSARRTGRAEGGFCAHLTQLATAD